MSPERRERLRQGQLAAFVGQPYGLHPRSPQPSFEVSTQDRKLAERVVDLINAGGHHLVVAPHIGSASLAFLARALAVAAVGRKSVCIYSTDLGFPRLYRKLTMVAYGRFAVKYRLATPQLAAQDPHVKLILATSGDDLDRVASCGALVVDARRVRTAAKAEKLRLACEKQGVPLVFLTHDPWVRANVWLVQKEYAVHHEKPHLPPAGPAPKDLEGYTARLRTYVQGPEIVPRVLDDNCAPLEKLQQARDQIIRVCHKHRMRPLVVEFVDQANDIMQNAVLPADCYERAYRLRGTSGLGAYSRAIESSLLGDLPVELRPRILQFLNALRDARTWIEGNLPAKFEHLKRHILDHREEKQIYLLCRTANEREAAKVWNREHRSMDLPRLAPVGFAEIGDDPLPGAVVVPGPPRRSETRHFIDGSVANATILVYPWQAREWNKLQRRTRKTTPKTPQRLEVPKSDLDAEDVDEWEDDAFDYAPPPPIGADADDDALEGLVREGKALRRVTISTNKGAFTFHENAEVPVMDAKKVTDRPVTHLTKGDVILVRSDGTTIDARGRVDALARTDPMMAELAERATHWRKLLGAYVATRKDATLPDVYRELFPHQEVERQTFTGWIRDPSRIGPNNKNTILLLERLGIPRSYAEDLRDSIRAYRSYRSRVYSYLHRQWRKHATKLSSLDEADPETDLEEDESVDSKFGLTLRHLASLVAWARVLDEPRVEAATQTQEASV